MQGSHSVKWLLGFMLGVLTMAHMRCACLSSHVEDESLNLVANTTVKIDLQPSGPESAEIYLDTKSM